MFEFHAEGGGALQVAAAFEAFSYANISFFAAGSDDILLHVSLRQDQGLAVFNRRIAGVWGAERPVPVVLGAVALLRIGFDLPRVVVTVDGAAVFDLAEADVPDLGQVAWHEMHGGFDAASLRLEGAGNLRRQGLGGLVHVAPFGIEGWALDRALPGQDIRLAIDGMAEPPVPFVQERADLAGRGGTGVSPGGVQMQLPGRVWQGLGAEAALQVRLTANGVACGPVLQITRAAMRQALDLLLEQPGVETGAETAILCLEHVQHGGFWPDLSEPARQALRRIARTYGLEALLPASAPVPLAPQAAPPLDQSLAEAVVLALVAAHRAARSDDPGQDLADRLARLPPLPPAARRQVYRQLTEAFCAAGRFDTLYARAAAEGLADVPEALASWEKSLHLPYLLAAGHYARLRDVFWQVVGDEDSWLSTAAIAWVMGEVATGGDAAFTPAWREEVIYPYLDLMQRRGWSYWGRAGCSHLIRAMVGLLQAGPGLPDWLADRVMATALRVLGLSRTFWDAVDVAETTGRLVLRPDLAAARAAFAVIAARVAGAAPDPAAVEAAFALFDRLGAQDAPRLRREVLGPLGLAAPAEGALAVRLMARAEGAGPAALRALAFPADPPLVPEAEAEALAPLLRRTVAAAHDGVAHSALHGLQATISRRIAALLADPAAPVALDELFGDLATLAQDREQGLGLALAVALMGGLLAQGRGTEAQDILIRIETMLARLPAAAVQAFAGSLPVQNALAALRARFANEPCAQSLILTLADAASASDLPEATDPALDPPALFDILVVIISCRPYLDSRIPALKAAWADRLADLGIPVLVAVGGADGPARCEGQVLHLDAPDDYEGLPQKVLAAFDWVARHSRAAHVLKIDDDCFLDVEAFFHAQSWRKFAYYGRKLTRTSGQLDRAWHQAKSTTARGRLELDRSPEPSTYCDGGSGYVLSRQALAALAATAATAPGIRLIQASFMEDKLVGDLLALAGVTPADEDHLVAILRRSHAGATPVSLWSNSFLPSTASGIKLAHLDRMETQGFAADLQRRPQLWPPKIWPGYAPTSLVYNSNLLDLISPVAKLQALNRAPVAVVATLRNERRMLPHFLAHYRALGVSSFLIADNLSDDGTLDALLAEPDVVTFSVDSDYRVSNYGVAWQQAILSNLRVGRWSLVADADELMIAPPGQSLEDVVNGLGAADAARLFMLDLYPQGPLSAATFETGPFAEAGFCDARPFRADWPGRGPFGDQETFTSALRHRLMPGSRPELFVAQKVALLKYQPWMRLSAGLHYVGDVRLAARDFLFGHFKYNADFAARARAEVARRQHFNDAEEYRRYLAILQEGREVIFDPDVSVPWPECEEVRRILGRA